VEDRTGKDSKTTLIFARLFRQRCWRGVNSRVANSLQFASWISLLASSSPAHRIVPPSKISAWSELLSEDSSLHAVTLFAHVTHPSSLLFLLVDGGLMEMKVSILRLTTKNRESCGPELLDAYRPSVQ
jgi:hypothetical protein